MARIDLADVDAAAELTSEQAYDQALDAEVRWHVLADGTLTRRDDAAPDSRLGVGRGRPGATGDR